MSVVPKPRIRKLVHGYKLTNKVVVGPTFYNATLIKTAPREWTVTILDKDNVAISIGTAETLKLAKEKMLGQLSALGAQFPVNQPKSIAIEPIEPEVTYNIAVDVQFDNVPTSGAGGQIFVTVTDDQNMPVAGVLVTLSSDSNLVFNENNVLTNVNGQMATVAGTLPGLDPGTYTVTATVEDFTGTDTFNVYLPQLTSIQTQFTQEQPYFVNQTFNIDVFCRDQYGNFMNQGGINVETMVDCPNPGAVTIMPQFGVTPVDNPLNVSFSSTDPQEINITCTSNSVTSNPVLAIVI